MDFLKRLWGGEISFPVTFWAFGFGGNLIFGIVKMVLFIGIMANYMSDNGGVEESIMNLDFDGLIQATSNAFPWLIPFLVIEFIYFVFMTGAIWNSSQAFKAEMHGDTVWPFLAIAILGLSWLNYIANYMNFAGLL